jgi:hypothetical protein
MFIRIEASDVPLCTRSFALIPAEYFFPIMSLSSDLGLPDRAFAGAPLLTK